MLQWIEIEPGSHKSVPFGDAMGPENPLLLRAGMREH
jgi:hypothetical protein